MRHVDFIIAICLTAAGFLGFLAAHNIAAIESHGTDFKKVPASEDQGSVPKSFAPTSLKPFRHCPDTFSHYKTTLQIERYFDKSTIRVTRDKAHAYINGEILPHADPATFELLALVSDGAGDSYVARDSNHVFFGPDEEAVEPYKQHAGHIVFDADPASFQVLWDIQGSMYGKDNRHVFNWRGIIPDADPSTFDVYRRDGYLYLLDSRRAYEIATDGTIDAQGFQELQNVNTMSQDDIEDWCLD